MMLAARKKSTQRFLDGGVAATVASSRFVIG